MLFLFKKDLTFIKNLTPTLEAQYIIGDELEQNLSIYHNQSISNRSYYALSFLKEVTMDIILINLLITIIFKLIIIVIL